MTPGDAMPDIDDSTIARRGKHSRGRGRIGAGWSAAIIVAIPLWLLACSPIEHPTPLATADISGSTIDEPPPGPIALAPAFTATPDARSRRGDARAAAGRAGGSCRARRAAPGADSCRGDHRATSDARGRRRERPRRTVPLPAGRNRGDEQTRHGRDPRPALPPAAVIGPPGIFDQE